MMKGNTLLVLLTIATLSLTACGKDSEPAETVVEETSVEETTPVETDTENPESEMDSKIKEAVAELDALLENGEITQEDYDREVESITQLIKAMYSVSPDELDLSEDYLPDELKGLDEKTEEEIEELFQEMEKENYEQFAQEEIPEKDNGEEITWEDLFGTEKVEEDRKTSDRASENAPNITWTEEEYNEFVNSNQ